MTPRHANLAVLASVVAILLAFAVGLAHHDDGVTTRLTRALFVATVVLEAYAQGRGRS